MALKSFSESIEIAEKDSPSSRICQCLLIATISDNTLRFEEKRGDLDVLQAALQAQESIRSFIGHAQ